jgi:hypothetical protein
MNNSRYFISDFVEIQRQSFLDLLKKGLITEFQKQNPIISNSKEITNVLKVEGDTYEEMIKNVFKMLEKKRERWVKNYTYFFGNLTEEE